MEYYPMDMQMNQFFGQWSQVLNLSTNLNFEMRQKYFMEYNAHFKTKLELESVPYCFDQCVSQITDTSGLTGNEKNCIRECYFKR